MGAECFVVFAYPGPALSWRSIQQFHRWTAVLSPRPPRGNKDGLTCVAIGASTNARMEGAIVNCRFINLKSDFSYSHAFAAPLCEGNEVIGCDYGFALEPADRQFGTWIVRKNRFRGIIASVTVKWRPTGSLNTIQFEDNDVVLKVAPADFLRVRSRRHRSEIRRSDGQL